MGMMNSVFFRKITLSLFPPAALSSPKSKSHKKTFSPFTTTSRIASVMSESKSDPRDQRMIWVDCEMTGLDITKDKLIEIAVVVTDKDLNILKQGPNLVIHQSKEVMDNMNEWCVKQHGLSGLTQRVLESKIDMGEAERRVMEFVKEWTPAGKCPLAGNSVGEDKRFIEKFMPELYRHLHYRIIDVSTIKELSKPWYPLQYAQAPKKQGCHLALDDILESIEELKYYQGSVFKSV